jgi:hypothetical protein
MNLEALVASIDASQVFLVVITVVMIVTVVMWHVQKPDFDLSQCLVDSASSRVSPEKVGYMVVLVYMTWSFVAQTLKGSLTEWFSGLYVGAFVAGRLGSQFLATKKDIANAQPPSPPPVQQ